MDYKKSKSVAKTITVKGPGLSKIVLDTLKTVSDIVGATLGPGGRQVLIERQEFNMGPICTKDGVTVFRSLGFRDATKQCIMESARDAAVKTASEAGDGTTTATILAEAITRLINEYCTTNRRSSPQKVVRQLETAFRDVIEPTIKALSIKVDSTTSEGQHLLKSIAKVSANGDEDLAVAVMRCFNLVGDAGNVSITELSGPSSYEVTSINGYPIPIGYEDCCAKFSPKFINNAGAQTCSLEDPVFVLYNGSLSEVQTAYALLSKVGDKFLELIQGDQTEYRHHNVIFVAAGFSETVLATFSAGFSIPNALKIFPLVIPKSPMPNYQSQFLSDLSAVTGANVFDPISKPLDTGTLEDLGPGLIVNGTPGSFEATRFRCSVIGRASELGEEYETRLLDQISVIESLLEKPESELDKLLLQERLGKITGGIAKLVVVGASNGELKEKRDRAEDAVCAVRGAIKHGCLPGGGWALLKVISLLDSANPVIREVLKPALLEPPMRLLFNCGLNVEEAQAVLNPILMALKESKTLVYDCMNSVHGDAIELGILDSTQAVLESLRSSISIASLLGTLGGASVFERDSEFERTEASSIADFVRSASGDSEANSRQ